MHDRVADPEETHQNEDGSEVRGVTDTDYPEPAQYQPRNEQTTTAMTIDQKPHRDLHHRGTHRHNHQGKPERGIADAESLFQHREERRQTEKVEVITEVSQANQADNLEVMMHNLGGWAGHWVDSNRGGTVSRVTSVIAAKTTPHRSCNIHGYS